MDKSFYTNVIAAGLVVLGVNLNGPLAEPVLSMGMFALAGALTNWLAIHMLFERVPGLYGSGVISARFNDFKEGIHALVMNQFFTQQNLDRFMADMVTEDADHRLDFEDVIAQTDLNPTFDSLVETIMESSFGSMLAMFGGQAALSPLKQPFIDKMKTSLNNMAHSPSFQASIREKLTTSPVSADIAQHIEFIVKARLDELTPDMVKQIIQTMIREHLGWLVVWGGVFGGLIGLIASLMTGLVN